MSEIEQRKSNQNKLHIKKKKELKIRFDKGEIKVAKVAKKVK